jgi:SNF2 family DNA or RNA helicase
MIYISQTPLQNKAEDIHSLFQFLRLVPFEDKKVFMRFIGRPILNGDPLGTSFLRTV